MYSTVSLLAINFLYCLGLNLNIFLNALTLLTFLPRSLGIHFLTLKFSISFFFVLFNFSYKYCQYSPPFKSFLDLTRLYPSLNISSALPTLNTLIGVSLTCSNNFLPTSLSPKPYLQSLITLAIHLSYSLLLSKVIFSVLGFFLY